MTPPSVDTTKVDKHKSDFALMDSDHLLSLWTTSAEEGWMPEGTEALREVIVERLGFLPRRGVPYSPGTFPDAGTYHSADKIEGLALRLETMASICKVLAILALVAAGGVFMTTVMGFSGGGLLFALASTFSMELHPH